MGIGDWGIGPIPNPHFEKIFIKNYFFILKRFYLIFLEYLYLKIDHVRMIFQKLVLAF